MRVVLHAGAHKTGTTTIQTVLAKGRRELRHQGVVYPRARRFPRGGIEAHHRFAHAIAQGRTDEAARFLDDVIARLRSDDALVVLSAEAIYRHRLGSGGFWARRSRYLGEVAELLDRRFDDVRVLLCLRRHDRWAEAMWAEATVRSLVPETFEEWLESHRDLCDHSAQVAAFERAFGQVDVYAYEEAVQRGVVDAFFERIGVAPPQVRPGWQRRSPDPRLLLWMHEARPGTREQRIAFASSDEASSLWDDDGRVTVWPSHDRRRAWLEGFDGPYGPAWFPAAEDERRPARLDEETARSIEAAYGRWLTRRRRLLPRRRRYPGR